MIRFFCSGCGKSFKVKDELAGRKAKCPDCSTVTQVPAASPLEASPTASASQAPPIPSDAPPPPTTGPEEVPLASKQIWWLLGIVGIAGLASVSFVPTITLCLGLLILAVCVGALLRTGAESLKILAGTWPVLGRIQNFCRQLLSLNFSRKLQTSFRLIVCGLVGVLFIIIGTSSAISNAKLRHIASEKSAQQDEANLQVTALMNDAETKLQAKHFDSAIEKLEQASKVPNTTAQEKINQLQTRIADAKVDFLVERAMRFAKAGDLDSARKQLATALDVPLAENFSRAVVLDMHINSFTNPEAVRGILMTFEDQEFESLRESKTLPPQFSSGYEEVERITLDLINSQLLEIAEAREAAKQRRKAEAKLAEEAAKNRAEIERAVELAESQKSSKSTAWRMAQHFLKQYLKSPSTASFGGGIFSDDRQDPVSCVTISGNRYKVTGWVDSQNSFGATVRSIFFLEMEPTGNDNWKLIGTPLISTR